MSITSVDAIDSSRHEPRSPMKSDSRSKLVLQRERIRTLDPQQLAGAAGGITSRFCTWDRMCPMGPDGPLVESRDC